MSGYATLPSVGQEPPLAPDRSEPFPTPNWDRDLAPPGTPPPVPDYRPLLRAAGFTIETYEEIPEAEAKRRAIYERWSISG